MKKQLITLIAALTAVSALAACQAAPPQEAETGLVTETLVATISEQAAASAAQASLQSPAPAAEETQPEAAETQAAANEYIGEDAAKEAALNHAGLSADQVSFVKTKLDRDDGRTVYEVEFYSGNSEYDYDIDASTGDIVSYDYDAEDYAPAAKAEATKSEAAKPAATQSTTEYIGEEAAKAAALNHAGLSADQVSFVKTQLDRDDGRTVYEVEFYSGNSEYDYDIDASTGDIVSYDYDAEDYAPAAKAASSQATTAEYIGEDAAKEAALSHAGLSSGQVSFIKAELDRDDGRTVYEIDFYSGSTEYEYEVDAASGDIVSYEIDR